MLCTRCDARASCKAMGGLDGTARAALVLTNHALIGSSLEQVGRRGLLLVDESPALFEHTTISLADIDCALQAISRFYRKYGKAVMPFLFLVRAAVGGRLSGETLFDALMRKGRDLRLDLAFFQQLLVARIAVGLTPQPVADAELEEMAERARDRYAETCAGVVSGLPEPMPYKAPAQKPRPPKQGGGATGKAVRNPRTASGARGRLP